MSDNTVSDERIAEIRATYGTSAIQDNAFIGDLLRALDQRTAERDAAAVTERSATVAWLRHAAHQYGDQGGRYGDGFKRALIISADLIERGEHYK